MAPDFLTVDDVLQVHQAQLERYGGAPGIRDWWLLQSAVMQPRQTFGGQYLNHDLAEMAAAYLFHLTRSRPFAARNARVALGSALVFLRLNGAGVDVDAGPLLAMTQGVAHGDVDKANIGVYFRTHLAAA